MTKALWHDSPTSSSLKAVALKQNSEDKIQVQSLYSFISIGTERTIARGLIPPEMGTEMNVPYMEGALQLPVKYGYSLVGKVKAKNHALNGQFVHLLHPHQSDCWVSPDDLHLIPKGIPPLRATLASNMETAVNAIWDAKISLGDKVLIIGFGVVGALIALVARQFPAMEIHIIEKNPARVNTANKMGFMTLTNIDKNDYDVAFNTTGNESGLQKSIDAVGLEGKIIEMSWYASKPVSIYLGHDFHWKRKKIISSQVSIIPTERQHRWDYRRRKELVFDLLNNPIFDTLITQVIEFEESPAFFNALRKKTPNDLGICIKY